MQELLSNLKKHSLNEEQNSAIAKFLSSDLSDFVHSLQELEKAASTLNNYSKDIQDRLDNLVNNLLKTLQNLEKKVNHKLALKQLKAYFRQVVGFSAYKSWFVKRAFEKPFGYPGDYILLDKIYDNEPVAEGFGRYWDCYFLNDGLANAVRDRKNQLIKFIKQIITEEKRNKIKIFNVACGSSRDLVELFSALSQEQLDLLEVTCLDQEEKALEFSKGQLDKFKVKVTYLKDSIVNLSNLNITKQDIAYSIGLTDYLPTRILTKFLASCYQLVNNNGKLFIAHKDHTIYIPTVQDWFCNWTFYPREHKELEPIINSLADENKNIISFRGSYNIMYYFVITKICS